MSDFKPYNARHRSLRQILGEYDFGRHAAVYLPGTDGIELLLTEHHELTHVNLCSTTTIGVFKQVSSRLADDPDISADFRARHASALDAATKASWATHEGAATATELTLINELSGTQRFLNSLPPAERERMQRDVLETLGLEPSARKRLGESKRLFELLPEEYGEQQPQQFYESLPPEYLVALAPFAQFLHDSNVRLLPLMGPLVHSVARVALGTTILEVKRSYTDFMRTDWHSFFSRQENSPDRRLEQLFSELSGPGVTEAVTESLLVRASSFLGVAATEDEFVRAFHKLDRARASELDGILNVHAEDTLSSLCPFQTIVDGPRVKEQLKIFSESWQAARTSQGLPPSPALVLADASTSVDESRMVGGAVSYEPRRGEWYRHWTAYRRGALRRYLPPNRSFHAFIMASIQNVASAPDSLPKPAYVAFESADGSPFHRILSRLPFTPSRVAKTIGIQFNVDTIRELTWLLKEATHLDVKPLIVTHEPLLRWMEDRMDVETLFEAFRTIILPRSGSFADWEEVIAGESTRGQLLMCGLGNSRSDSDVLAVWRAGAPYFHARPTSLNVIQHILVSHAADPKIAIPDEWEELPPEFDASLIDSFSEHFVRVGYN